MNRVQQFQRAVWGTDRRARGLRLMTLGFLIAILGAGLAVVAATARDAGAGAAFTPILWLGWFVLLLGLGGMVGGILLNFTKLFDRRGD